LIWFLTSSDKNPDPINNALYAINSEVETSSSGEMGVQAKLIQVTSSSGNLIISLIVAFTVFTAAIHLIYFFAKNFYSKMIADQNNWVRWLEYAISATIMLVIIAISSGVKDFDVILLFIFASVSIMLLGDTVEKSIKKGSKGAISATVSAWLMLAGVFTVLLRSFGSTVASADGRVPGFVIGIVVITLMFFSSFGGVQIAQMSHFFEKRGGYSSVELTYIVLSFISKALLALLVVSGLAARSSTLN
jgi:hypothetical protein